MSDSEDDILRRRRRLEEEQARRALATRDRLTRRDMHEEVAPIDEKARAILDWIAERERLEQELADMRRFEHLLDAGRTVDANVKLIRLQRMVKLVSAIVVVVGLVAKLLYEVIASHAGPH